jgi:hypothetical protein
VRMTAEESHLGPYPRLKQRGYQAREVGRFMAELGERWSEEWCGGCDGLGRHCRVSKAQRRWRSPRWEQEREKSKSERAGECEQRQQRVQKTFASTRAGGSEVQACRPRGGTLLHTAGHGQPISNR